MLFRPSDEPSHPLQQPLSRWLRDIGIQEPRRVVRADDESVLVSKFEPGFAAGLTALLDLMPQLFEASAVAAAYERRAAEGSSAASRVETWHAAMHALLREAGERHGLSDVEQGEVRVGIDSVRAVLLAVLWSDPTLGDDYVPRDAEVAAYREALLDLDPGRDLFSRHYGTFEGRAVENHCPGAAFARIMLAQGWEICTGTPAPAGEEASRS
jgi:hypothetical protein